MFGAVRKNEVILASDRNSLHNKVAQCALTDFVVLRAKLCDTLW